MEENRILTGSLIPLLYNKILKTHRHGDKNPKKGKWGKKDMKQEIHIYT